MRTWKRQFRPRDLLILPFCALILRRKIIRNYYFQVSNCSQDSTIRLKKSRTKFNTRYGRIFLSFCSQRWRVCYNIAVSWQSWTSVVVVTSPTHLLNCWLSIVQLRIDPVSPALLEVGTGTDETPCFHCDIISCGLIDELTSVFNASVLLLIMIFITTHRRGDPQLLW